MNRALQVDLDDPTPPYEQIRRQLTHLVVTGGLAPGERLPPLRQLARDLGLAVGTVARSYAELEAAGLVTSRRGAGTRVADRPPVPGAGQSLARAAADFVVRARELGASGEEAEAAVREALRAGNARSGGGVGEASDSGAGLAARRGG